MYMYLYIVPIDYFLNFLDQSISGLFLDLCFGIVPAYAANRINGTLFEHNIHSNLGHY